MRWSGLLGWLGAVFIVFGLLSLLLQLATGGLFITRDLPFIWGNFGLGLVLLIVAAVTNADKIRERLSTGGAKRAGKYGTSAVVSTLLGIVVLALLAFLTTRYHERWDWTESGVHTLSGQARKIVEGLDEDVSFTGFYTAVNEPPVKDLLDRFAYVSDRVKLEFVDPQVNPGRSRALGIEDERLANGLLHVALGEESTEIEEVTEENVTNALVKLTRQGTKRVYFLEGHGERSAFEEAAEEPEGLSQAIDALRNENYETESLLLAATGRVPEDADVVVIAGPTRPLLEAEHKALREYAEGGGAILVMVDPRANTDLYPLISEWGMTVGEDVVVDRVQGLFGRPVSPFAAQYAAHPITENLREATLFHMARSVTVKPGAHPSLKELVLTGEDSWGERDLEEFFTGGPAAKSVPGACRCSPTSTAARRRTTAWATRCSSSSSCPTQSLRCRMITSSPTSTTPWPMTEPRADAPSTSLATPRPTRSTVASAKPCAMPGSASASRTCRWCARSRPSIASATRSGWRRASPPTGRAPFTTSRTWWWTG